MLDILLTRYSNIEYVLNLDIGLGSRLILKCIEKYYESNMINMAFKEFAQKSRPSQLTFTKEEQQAIIEEAEIARDKFSKYGNKRGE